MQQKVYPGKQNPGNVLFHYIFTVRRGQCIRHLTQNSCGTFSFIAFRKSFDSDVYFLMRYEEWNQAKSFLTHVFKIQLQVLN